MRSLISVYGGKDSIHHVYTSPAKVYNSIKIGRAAAARDVGAVPARVEDRIQLRSVEPPHKGTCVRVRSVESTLYSPVSRMNYSPVSHSFVSPTLDARAATLSHPPLSASVSDVPVLTQKCAAQTPRRDAR